MRQNSELVSDPLHKLKAICGTNGIKFSELDLQYIVFVAENNVEENEIKFGVKSRNISNEDFSIKTCWNTYGSLR